WEEVAALPVDAVDGILQRQGATQPAVGGVYCNVGARKLGHLRNLAKGIFADKWQCVLGRQPVGISNNNVAGSITAAEIKCQTVGYNLTAPSNDVRICAARHG